MRIYRRTFSTEFIPSLKMYLNNIIQFMCLLNMNKRNGFQLELEFSKIEKHRQSLLTFFYFAALIFFYKVINVLTGLFVIPT